MSDLNLEELIDRHLRGELNDSEKERLTELLDTSATARQEFVEQAHWDTEFAEALRESRQSPRDADLLAAGRAKTDGQWASKPTFLRLLLGAAVVVIVALSAGLIYQLGYPEAGIPETNNIATQRRVSDESIARITGLSGSLIWTGDRGQIVRDVKIGTELAGGTIEGMAPDSWFELQFNDGSTVMISGTSMLTFADLGQKHLRLREGRLSANVAPQRVGKPMLIHTRSAVLEVLGTQFDVEANLDSTMLNVSEGKVRLRRLSDGSEVDVPAKHHVTTDTDDDLLSVLLPDSVHEWKSQLHLKPGNYGKWQPATEQQLASVKAIPLILPTAPKITLYLAGLSIHRSDGSPVVVLPGSKFVVRGRLRSEAGVHFGIRVLYPNGEFAGMFRGDLHEKQPLSAMDRNGRFEEVYELQHFTIDPAVYDRRDELAASPDGLILDGVWAFTYIGGPSGLEITEVELVPPGEN
ncbi:MAG: FecR family protein [Fuerstiella sp.]|nr:FecR family protein [Fuerstiella sp.]